MDKTKEHWLLLACLVFAILAGASMYRESAKNEQIEKRIANEPSVASSSTSEGEIISDPDEKSQVRIQLTSLSGDRVIISAPDPKLPVGSKVWVTEIRRAGEETKYEIELIEMPKSSSPVTETGETYPPKDLGG